MIFFTDKSNENKGKHYQMKHTYSATHCTLTDQQSLTSKITPESTSLSKTILLVQEQYMHWVLLKLTAVVDIHSERQEMVTATLTAPVTLKRLKASVISSFSSPVMDRKQTHCDTVIHTLSTHHLKLLY